MSRNSSRIKEMEVGRRTGLTLPPTSTFIASDGLENPGQLFDAAAIVEESPNASIDGSIEKGHDASTALADFAAAKQPKIKVRFSLGDDVAEQLDSTITTGSAIKAHHPVRKLISGKNRESIDTMDLSSVSTAPSVTSLKHFSDANDDDEDHVEASRLRLQRSEEMEIASVVAAAQKKQKSETSSPIMAAAPDMGYDDEEEEDFMPPPPPDSPRHDDDDDHVEEELHTQPDNDVDFPNTVDDEDNDDDDDGAGYQVPHDDEEDDGEDDDDDVKHSESTTNGQRRDKEKRMEKLAAKKNKKKNGLDDGANGADDAVKPKSKMKKKTNPYSTVFSPKGMPGPRTYKEIPLSDLKPETPEDTQTRRSKRVRTQPLEFWRGERQILGGNNFGDEYDGVKNMPVVIGIAKPDPTPYKKRKVVPIVSHQKKKGGDSKNLSKRGKHDEPAMIAADELFDDRALREKLTVNEGKVAHLWDERIQETRGIKVVSYVASAKSNDLPISKKRKKSEGKIVGKAAQSFQMSNEENPAFPGYIVGHLLLPPKGIKDAESVGLCAQVFTVVKGQANSIEVAYGDPEHDGSTWDPTHAERFLLAPGDNFLVPPGNSYRLHNHSTTTECLLSWTIIRHNAKLLANDDE